jgi:hypothetical protein
MYGRAVPGRENVRTGITTGPGQAGPVQFGPGRVGLGWGVSVFDGVGRMEALEEADEAQDPRDRSGSGYQSSALAVSQPTVSWLSGARISSYDSSLKNTSMRSWLFIDSLTAGGLEVCRSLGRAGSGRAGPGRAGPGWGVSSLFGGVGRVEGLAGADEAQDLPRRGIDARVRLHLYLLRIDCHHTPTRTGCWP